MMSPPPMPKKPEAHPVAAVFRVLPRQPAGAASGLEGVPLAYIAVIGFDSNDMQYKHNLVRNYGQVDDGQLQWSRRLISTLRDGVAHRAPLYVMGAALLK